MREHIFLFLRRHRRIGGDEAGSGERVLRKVAFDQEPPGGCRRQLRAPGRNFVIRSARRLELIEKFESRGESIGAESILGQRILQSVPGCRKINQGQLLAVSLHLARRKSKRVRSGIAFDFAGALQVGPML